MRDFGRSDNPDVQKQLDRLAALSLPQGRIGLDTIRELLKRLGGPHRSLPPVFHVAGTNGKGSVCAFLRAMLEADGKRVHCATSPHLVRYNERIRIAGRLIADERLAELLAEVLDHADGLAPSFFEVTIAASFLAFSREPADACVIEVGLGGRFDATNVLEHPAASGIAALGMDHERFLLAPEEGVPDEQLARIAFEKAGIAKRGVSLVTLSYPEGAELEVERAAARHGSPLAMRGSHWSASTSDTALHYADRHGELVLPLPALPGAHQAENAALALAMLRHQDYVSVSESAYGAGIRSARWPARLQRLAPGPLTGDRAIWLDGGHNRSAGEALARYFEGQSVHLVTGMIEAKDPAALIEPMKSSLLSITVVPVPGYDCHTADAFGADARAAIDVAAALGSLPDDGLPVLIAGSLYLAGDVLRLNEELPD
ncbi:bifunctional folylpolyglutamate synthase/dihydrofolate synthase [Qipengyuania atrilutea]|uniref:tetrahydrofolate synthase n=1 Tax=Qipengyuania atrilutea TaxID=2744473 RepID=A0A850GWU4_9SPHN|nr:folylpolyglutamate synthase/dihydrofolate synthase family protein [Actirhodobacter atriluteus]NVD44021.1 bifunctional folylpolyglutamate synthase/dihydrofolate synthase [Actirhodobacter atriluteus]